jgi:hypothetical protein
MVSGMQLIVEVRKVLLELLALLVLKDQLV